MIKSHERGWPIEYIGGHWVYSDNKKLIDGKRNCVRCGKKPTKDGHDACLGFIPNCTSACCGHGITNKFIQGV